MSNFTFSINSNKQEEIQKAYDKLILDVSDETQICPDEIEKLNAKGLLEYSLAYPPMYNQINKNFAWVSNFFGAMLSSPLAVTLVVLSFHPETLTPQFLNDTFLKSIRNFILVYVGLGKKPWEFYSKIVTKHKIKLDNFTYRLSQKVNVSKEKNESVLVCKEIF